MHLLTTLLRILALFIILTKVYGDGCTSITTYTNQVINMCERGNWTLGRVYISITTSNMGSNTRCNCTVRARTTGQETRSTFVLYNVETNVNRCNESLIQITSPERIDIYCTSTNNTTFHTGQTTNDFMILLSRADVMVGVSYCLFVQPDTSEDNGFELVCGSDVSPPPSSATTSSTTQRSFSLTSSAKSSTTSSPSSSSPVPVTSATNATQTPISTDPIASSPPMPLTTLPSATSSESSAAPSIDTGRPPETAAFSVAAVAGGVGGGVAGIIIVVVAIVIIIVICKRRRQKPARVPELRAEENAAYMDEDLEDPRYSTADDAVAKATNRPHSKTPSASVKPSTSQTGSQVGLLAAASSPYEFEDEPPQDDGAVNIDMAAGSASLTLSNMERQPPNPAGDEYAVVDKSKGKKPQKPQKPHPAKPPKLATRSKPANTADVTTASAGGGAVADLYAVVDKSRNKGDNAREKSSLPSSEAMPSSDPSSPGLLYADLEEVRGEGRRSAPPRPPADMAVETEYADIDHVATAEFASDA